MNKFFLIIAIIYIILLIVSVLDTFKNYKQQQEIIRFGHRYEGKVQQLIALDYEYSLGPSAITYEKTVYRIDCTVEDSIGNVKHYYSDILPRYRKHRVPNYVEVYSYLGRTYITWDRTCIGVKHSISKTREIVKEKKYRLVLHDMNELYILFSVFMIGVYIMCLVGVVNF